MAKTLKTADIRLLLGKLSVEGAATITAGTNASPAVFTLTAHGWSTGDFLYISGATGLTNANGLRTVVVVDANSFTLLDAAAGTAVNGNGTFGGTVLAVRIKSGLFPGDLLDLSAAMDKRSNSLGPFSDVNRAAETALASIFTGV